MEMGVWGQKYAHICSLRDEIRIQIMKTIRTRRNDLLNRAVYGKDGMKRNQRLTCEIFGRSESFRSLMMDRSSSVFSST